MRLQRPQAFAGFLIVGLLALVGFAAFSATWVGAAPPVDIPAEMSARVAGAVLGIDLGPDAAPVSVASEPTYIAPPAPPSVEPELDAVPHSKQPVTNAPPTTTAPTTTAAPTKPTAPTTTTTTAGPYPPGVVGGARDVEEWRALVQQYFPAERVDEALFVMECESRGDPLAQHPTTFAAGLFQFMPSTWDWASGSAGFGGHSAFEPEANVASAAWLVAATISSGDSSGPWAHWSCRPPPPVG